MFFRHGWNFNLLFDSSFRMLVGGQLYRLSSRPAFAVVGLPKPLHEETTTTRAKSVSTNVLHYSFWIWVWCNWNIVYTSNLPETHRTRPKYIYYWTISNYEILVYKLWVKFLESAILCLSWKIPQWVITVNGSFDACLIIPDNATTLFNKITVLKRVIIITFFIIMNTIQKLTISNIG